MKVFKLVVGILCIVLSVMVTLQSCAVGIGNTLLSSDEISGSAGIILAVLLLASGIVMVATRKSVSVGGEVASIIMFSTATLIGSINAGSYSDLRIWSGLCFVLAVINLIFLYTK